MNDLDIFLKENKLQRPNVKFVASEDFKDKNGNSVEWEIRPLKSKEMDNIRVQCTKTGKNGPEVDTTKLNRMVATRATVFPNLEDKKVQDSYGVMCAEDLIQELLDNDGDYMNYIGEINKISGYRKDSELEEEAKN